MYHDDNLTKDRQKLVDVVCSKYIIAAIGALIIFAATLISYQVPLLVAIHQIWSYLVGWIPFVFLFGGAYTIICAPEISRWLKAKLERWVNGKKSDQ